MNQFKYLLFSLCIFTLYPSEGNGENCQTVTEKPGQCILIRSCNPLFELLKKQPISPENIRFLQKSQCGFEGKQPKVCCPLDDNQPIPGDEEEEITSDLLPDASQCGQSESDRIVGGTLTGLREYPWMALLEYETPYGRRFKCGGALINNRYVLTAAHCLKRIPADNKLVSVRLGEHQLDADPDCENSQPGFEYCSSKPIDVTVEEKIAHEQYVRDSVDQHHDIALLRLSKTVNIEGDFVKPICLPSIKPVRNSNYDGQKMVVAGWGRTENMSLSNIKLQLEVPITLTGECIKKYAANNRTILNSQLCAGGDAGKDSCAGDSGGPLMYLHKTDTQEIWYLYGVVSYGPTVCGIKDFPGVYTKVSNYIEWIISNLKP